ncbi:DNA replication and repair protein RecF [Allopseudospirillum japonicum]|uniref:DNA replication and repair protein RecF n=1 Tax=Allopseudospirillum japonicum TaxID=64971 RepID=A0A1H6RKS6_9GAMM|nr:DNA replication/repair protein RecF [Allopseudospirillum japonicum]SEI52195.1 DNA replication and repair protein RecF [Allopseudospirillum japonicum]
MTLERLDIHSLRNLQPTRWQPNAHINVVYGANASGKTSLLEAVHILGLGRSFRHKSLLSSIQHQQDSLHLYAKVRQKCGASYRLAIQRERQQERSLIYIQEQSVRTTAELAACLPIQLITPDSLRLLEGAPQLRRQYLDWGAFHAHAHFLPAWQGLQNALKQRNSLLKHAKIDPSYLQLWDNELIRYTQVVHQARLAYLEMLQPVFIQYLQALTLNLSIELTYYPGWDKKYEYSDALTSSRARDQAQGFTSLGAQRADLRIRYQGHNALNILSRGQQKLVVSALKLAQGALLTDKACVYLVDDLAAELDAQHRKNFCQLLVQQGKQVFMTCIDAKHLVPMETFSEADVSWFHVEQGQLTPVDFSRSIG